MRNSVDFSLNNDLKRYSIASNHSQTSLANGNCNSYLYKKHQQLQQTNSNSMTSELNSSNQPPNRNSLNGGRENGRSSDNASFTKLFPISRYTSKVQAEEHQFIVPSIPTPTYYENLANARFSYASDNGSNSLGISNNSAAALYASIPRRPKTLNLSASYNQPFIGPNAGAIYGQMLSSSYNCPFNSSSISAPFYQLNGSTFNGQSLNSSTSSSFYSANNSQLQGQLMHPPTRSLPIANNVNFINTNTNHLNPINPQPSVYHTQPPPTLNQPIHQPIHQTVNHPQISSSSSHQSTSSSSYNYLSSASSSLVNTPSSMSSSVSPFHQTIASQPQQQQQMSQPFNQQAIKQPISNQFRNLPSSSTNTAIVSPFCKQTTNIVPDSLKKSEEKLKRATDDIALNRTLNNQIMFRDSMRLTRLQREQTLARIQQNRSSWTPSSSPSGSPLGSSSNSSDQSTPCNDINKLINELSNFDAQRSEQCNEDEKTGHQMNGKSDPIYGVNIARTRFSFPFVQGKTNENAIKGDMNVLKQSNSANVNTNINDFKKLLSSKASEQVNGMVKKSASEQLNIITRKPLSALSALEAVNEKMNENCLTQPDKQRTTSTTTDYYEKETYDNVTDEECENQSRLDFKANSSMLGLMNGNQQLTNGFANGLNSVRTRVINGRVYKTPYRLEAMHYPPINEEDNGEDGEFIVQQNTSTWV